MIAGLARGHCRLFVSTPLALQNIKRGRVPTCPWLKRLKHSSQRFTGHRSSPVAGVGRRLVYLPDISAWFPNIKSPFLISPPFHRIQDKIKAALNDAAESKANLTHFRPEVFQAAWLILIQDSEFLDAYLNGMVV